jgi:hypothetical protein
MVIYFKGANFGEIEMVKMQLRRMTISSEIAQESIRRAWRHVNKRVHAPDSEKNQIV